jgi:hypothetical protein
MQLHRSIKTQIHAITKVSIRIQEDPCSNTGHYKKTKICVTTQVNILKKIGATKLVNTPLTLTGFQKRPKMRRL